MLHGFFNEPKVIEQLAIKEHHPNCETWRWQHCAVGVFCWKQDCCTLENRWNNEEKGLFRNIEANPQALEWKATPRVCFKFQM